MASGALPPDAISNPPALTDGQECQKPRKALTFHAADPGDEFWPPALRSEPLTTADRSSSSTPAAAGPGPGSAGDLVVFRVVHKELSSMKRPLASVDNLKHGDIAIKTYTASDVSQDAGRPELAVDQRSSGMLLVRFLESSGLQEDIIKNVKSWKRETHDAVQIQLDQAIEPEHEQLLLDMMAARAFEGSGRNFQVYGSDQELKALSRLSQLALVVKAAPSSKRYCSARRSSCSNAGQSSHANAGQSSHANAGHAQVVHLLSEEEDQRTLEGEWRLTPKAVSVFTSRLRLGSPCLVFSLRPGVALQDKTTFELYLHVTALGFQETRDRASIQKAAQKPYTPKRGGSDSWGLPIVFACLQSLYAHWSRQQEGGCQPSARLPPCARVLQCSVFSGLPRDSPWTDCCVLPGFAESSD